MIIDCVVSTLEAEFRKISIGPFQSYLPDNSWPNVKEKKNTLVNFLEHWCLTRSLKDICH